MDAPFPPELGKQQYEAGFSAITKAEKTKKADRDADKVKFNHPILFFVQLAVKGVP